LNSIEVECKSRFIVKEIQESGTHRAFLCELP
jgi:hypothetical protein